MKAKRWTIVFMSLVLALLVSNIGVTSALFTDSESSTGNSFSAWVSSLWTQTTQTDFEAGVPSNVDTSSSPGDVKLANWQASWYDSNWTYRRVITINNQGSSLTDYQVKVDVTYDTDMQPDFDDIRFTDSDGSTELSYWQEIYTTSTSATYWVKVPSVPSGNKTISMYYGNATASSASDGAATFVFFDDFDRPDSATVGNGWIELETAGGTTEIAANALQFEMNNENKRPLVYKTFSALSGGFRWKIDFDWTWISTDPSYYLYMQLGDSATIDNTSPGEPTASDAPSAHTGTGVDLAWYRGSTSTNNVLSYYDNSAMQENVATISGNHVIEVTGDTTAGTYDINVDGGVVEKTGAGMNVTTTLDEMRFTTHSARSSYTSGRRLGYTFIAKYTSSDPVASVGSGETESSGQYISSGTLASQVFDTTITGAIWNSLFWDETLSSATDWYDSSWQYRRAISLNPATSMSNYQVLVTLDTTTMGSPYSNVHTDGSDIRFTGDDGTTLQDYWMESWNNTGTSYIWVEVSASGTSTIYMYYGNATASSASDGAATFVFFDDFDRPDSATVGNGWIELETAGGTTEIAANALQFEMNNENKRPLVYKTFSALSGGFRWKIDFDWTWISTDPSYYLYMQLGDSATIDNTSPGEPTASDAPSAHTGTGVDLAWYRGSTSTNNVLSYYDNSAMQENVATISGNHVIEVTGDTTAGTYDINVDGGVVEKTGAGMNVTTTLDEMRFTTHSARSSYTSGRRLGYTFIAKYTSSDPVASVGSGETYDTDITFEVRASDSPFLKDDSSPSWVAVGGSSPITSGLPTGRYIQWRTTLTNSDTTKTPTLHEVRVYYDQ